MAQATNICHVAADSTEHVVIGRAAPLGFSLREHRHEREHGRRHPSHGGQQEVPKLSLPVLPYVQGQHFVECDGVPGTRMTSLPLSVYITLRDERA